MWSLFRKITFRVWDYYPLPKTVDPKAVLKSQDLEGEEMLDDKESNFIILQGPQM